MARKKRNRSDFTIVIDTREKHPYRFPGRTVRKALRAGDYSIETLEDRVVVERKRRSELFACAGPQRKRFERLLEKLQDHEFAAIVIESDLKGLLLPSRFSRVSPKAVVNSLISWSVRFGVHVFFAGDRRYARGITYRILERFWKHRCTRPKDS